MAEARGRLVDLILGYTCNVRCGYCSIRDEDRPTNMPTRRVLAELQQAWEAGVQRVAFGGGEPTIRRDLLPLVRWCRDRGFTEIRVASNGMMYAYEDFARRAVEAGVTAFHVSVMGHTPALYGRVMGTPKAHALVCRGVRNLADLGHSPTVDVIVKDDTWRHLGAIVRHWVEQGARAVVLWLLSLTGRAAAHPEALPPVSVMRPGFDEAFAAGEALGVPVTTRHLPPCMLRGWEHHVRDVRDEDVLVVTPGSRFWLSESDLSPDTYTPRCDGCVLRPDRCPGARRDYLARHGDAELVPYLGEDAVPAALRRRRAPEPLVAQGTGSSPSHPWRRR